MIKRFFVHTVIILFIVSCKNGSKKSDETYQSENRSVINKSTALQINFDHLKKAVQKRNTHVWGSSPIKSKDGKIHLFVAEWPKPQDKTERFSGWFKHSQIAHYVGDKPSGPFEFLGIAIDDKNETFNAPHNPTIQFINNKYILCFIVNEKNDLTKQRIVMYVSDNLEDWKPAKGAKKDGTILEAPFNKNIWNYNPRLGISNPSLIKYNNKYMLYYKSVLRDTTGLDLRKNWDYGYGVAISDNVEGPYTYHPKRVTAEGLQLEDAYAFSYDDKVYMLSRDFKGSKGSHGGGLLWESEDGFYFSEKNVNRAYNDLQYYNAFTKQDSIYIFRGDKEGHLERPQLLIEDGKPSYMYVATGVNTEKGYGSCSHVFKLKIN